jgi:hypothetical protein
MLIGLSFQFFSLVNSFFSIYIIILFFTFGYLEILSEIFVVLGLATIFSIGFSANIRNIYLGSVKVMNLKAIILKRILIAFIGYFISIAITYIFIGKIFILFHSSLILLIFTNWILELIFARHEKTETLNFYYIINIFLLLLISFFFIFFKNIFFLAIFLIFNSLINILIFRKYFKNVFNQNLILKKSNLGYFSTLLKTIANFFFKYFIIIFVGKINGSFLFLGFAIGSFFGTLFDISYGALFLKKIKNKLLLINLIFIFYIFLVSLFIFFIKNLHYYTSYQNDIFVNTSILSLCGSYILVFALMKRQYFFEKKKIINICYKADIFIYSFNFCIVPIVFFLFGQQFLILCYFFSSIFFYFVYKIFISNVYSKKII